jgi:EAL domain-containing protein (putative c-di-GMP-specific phosphodiesterase class I)
MSASQTVQQNQPGTADILASILLLDTPENLGVDFLQMLQRRGVKISWERVTDKDGLFKALKKGFWDLLVVNYQIESPTLAETLSYMGQLECETGYVLLRDTPLDIDILTSAYRNSVSAVVSGAHPDYSTEVIVRAVEKNRNNLQLSRLNQEKFDLRRNCEQLRSFNKEALAYLQDGIHVFGNEAYQQSLGCDDADALLAMPFIDIVSPAMRDQVKDALLIYQQRLQVNPDTTALVLDDLCIRIPGAGIEQNYQEVTASFQQATYEGEPCIQVVLKEGAAARQQEAAGAVMEGLGYPLFITHLDNQIQKARAAGRAMGQVIHVQGDSFAHYIAGKGFGSLNAKMKSLATDLKVLLDKDDVLIRFTENSFLALRRGAVEDSGKTKEEGGTNGKAAKINKDTAVVLQSVSDLLEKYAQSMSAEIGGKDQVAVSLTHQVVTVDGTFASASEIINMFLPGTASNRDVPAAQVQQPEITPKSAKAPTAAKSPNTAKSTAEETVAKTRQAGDNVIPLAKKLELVPQEEADVSKVQGKQIFSGASEPAPATVSATISQNCIPETALDQSVLNEALVRNGLGLFYEAVMSVAEVETVFHDISLQLNDSSALITRASLGQELGAGVVGRKLDTWLFQAALVVIGDLYKKGLEYAVILPFTARSLADKRLVEQLQKDIDGTGLPKEMVMIDFSLADLKQDPRGAADQLGKLRDAGISACISEVADIRELKSLMGEKGAGMVRLDPALLGRAAIEEQHFSLLCQSVQKLHANNVRVFAGGINNKVSLNICCKAGIDLVKGAYIQKTPLEFHEESLAQAMHI